jgi:hypothetical protein
MTDTEKLQKLAQAIAEAGARVGTYNGQVDLSGPQLLMILDDLALQCGRDRAAIDAQAGEIVALKADIEDLKGRLTSIGDLAHDTSTGPAVQDTYWEIRSMAYAGV